MRKTGIDVIGDAPWGTHFCLFYHTQADLIDTMVPYFKAGLENNEFCMWVTSQPLGVEDAERVLRESVTNLDEYIEKGQIEFLDYRRWYIPSGRFEADKVLQGWIDKEDQAVERGFEGLRLNGNTFWLEEENWGTFVDYEAMVDRVIGHHRMLAVCTYSLDQCGALEIMDVVSNHQFALIKRNDRWEIIESTGRRQAVETLRESEEKFRSLFNNAEVGMFRTRLDGSEILDMNEKFLKIFGRTREEMRGLPSVIHWADPREREEMVRRLEAEGRVTEFECGILNKQGEERVCLASLTLFREQGIVEGSIIDITERKQVEAALRESESRWRSLTEDSPDHILTLDRDLNIQFANYASPGLTVEELIGTPLYTYIERERQAEIKAILEHVLETGGSATYETQFDTKDGDTIYYESRVMQRIVHDRVVGLTLSARDITDRKQAERQLRDERDFSDSLINTAQAIVLVLDLEGRIVRFNPYLEELCGYRLEEVQGKDWFTTFLPERDQEPIRAMFLKAIRSIQTRGNVSPIVTREGHERQIEWYDKTLKDAHGNTVGLLAIGLDVTERKQAEAALRHRTYRLEILHKIDKAILVAQSPKTITQGVLRDLAELVPNERSSVSLFDADQGEMVVLAGQSLGRNLEGLRFPSSTNVIEVLQRGDVYVTRDLLALPELGAIQKELIAEGLRSHINAPLLARGKLLGSLNIMSTKVDAFPAADIETVREVADSLAIAIQQARLLEKVQRDTERLRFLTSRLAEAEETERRRLARELHDRVGQNLAALGLHLAIIQSQLTGGIADQVHNHLSDAQVMVEQTTEIIRDVMADLRPPALDDYGLLAALRWYGKQFTGRTEIVVNVQGEEPDPRLASHHENELFRIAQEALANVTKHAQATQVTVTVEIHGETVRLIILDNGVGFDPTQLAGPDKHSGWGLFIMAERVEGIGGQVRIESQPGKGTRVIVEVPR